MIPPWSHSGVLPPFVGADPTGRAGSSPYEASCSEVASRFGTSDARILLLQSWIKYRLALQDLGVIDGFQWLDGSFLEDAESRLGRPPNDIDLVTFAQRPLGLIDFNSFVQKNFSLFSSTATGKNFSCDAYFVDLDKPANLIVDDTRYWYGLFSHRRSTFEWKGMIQVPLQSDDGAAMSILNSRGAQHASKT
jgi:hypothetical protein